MSELSFLNLKSISGDLLRERTAQVQVFIEEEAIYEALIKDRLTGEYYLHHAHLHLNVQEGGTEEHYHALLPLTNDEVIALTAGGQRLQFPDEWNKAFLRNGPEEQFVWFDPEMTRAYDADEQFGSALREKMLAFKRAGRFDAESMSGLFEDIERLKQANQPSSENRHERRAEL